MGKLPVPQDNFYISRLNKFSLDLITFNKMNKATSNDLHGISISYVAPHQSQSVNSSLEIHCISLK